MKHTEGWHIDDTAKGVLWVMAPGRAVAQVYEESEARLIAKAPEMAALLRRLLVLEDNDSDYIGLLDDTEALLAELEEHE